MRTIQTTKRVGEWLGPVDEGYDFDQHNWSATKGGVNHEMAAIGARAILEAAAEPTGWCYSPSGFSFFPVVEIGMYDGWPFWRPTPAIGYLGPLGAVEVAFFYNIRPENFFRREAASR